MFLDYNQNAKDRTIASAYSVRPTPDARVSAPLAWDEIDACDPATSRSRTMPARFAGDRRPPRRHRRASVLARARCSSCRRARSARGWATRRGRRTTGSSRASRRACSRRAGATPKHPLIEIGRAQRKDDALAGLERWKARHPEAAAHLEPADVLVDAMRGRFRTWTRIRVNLQHVPDELRPRRRRSIRTTHADDWSGVSDCRRGRAEDLLELVRRRDLELIVAAVARRLVRPPALEDRRVAEAVALHVVVLDLAHALDPQRLPRQILARAPAALPARHARRRRRRPRPPTRATDAPRARRSRSGASSLRQLLAHRHRERRGHADVVQRAAGRRTARAAASRRARPCRSCASGSRRRRSRRCARA